MRDALAAPKEEYGFGDRYMDHAGWRPALGRANWTINTANPTANYYSAVGASSGTLTSNRS